jgi:hypothetical protein
MFFLGKLLLEFYFFKRITTSIKGKRGVNQFKLSKNISS